jgi:hypothetical protein
MKYALSILSFLFLTLNTSPVFARTIKSFQDSDAIMSVARFMYDAAEDMPISTRISDKKINIKDMSGCKNVSADEVLASVEAAIKKVMRFYPDEDIPGEQALVDLEDYLDHRDYKECDFNTKSKQSQVVSQYFLDTRDEIHLRLDNVALKAE